jgi:hypothetical protein
VRARFVRIATALMTGLALPFVATAPAWARVDDGQAPTHTGTLFVLAIFVCIPAGFFLLVAALTYAPSIRRRPRYRPTRDWRADAVWFNGPPDPERALASAPAEAVKGGGASASW